MIMERFIILFFVLFALFSYGEVNGESNRSPILTITVKGINKQIKQKVTTKGKAFVIQNRQQEVLLVTNFHVIDSAESITDIFAETRRGEVFSLRLTALSPIHDFAFLSLSDKSLSKELLTERILPFYKSFPPNPFDEVYLKTLENQELKTIPLHYISYHNYEAVFDFFINEFKNLNGMSGSPILDKQGSVIGILHSWLGRHVFGTSSDHFTYRVNSNLKKCSSDSANQCILKARKQLLKQTLSSSDLKTQKLSFKRSQTAL